MIDYEKDTMPYFETSVCDNNGNSFIDEKLKFGIDTGAPQTILVKVGIEHLFGSVEQYYDWCSENNFEISETAPTVMIGNLHLNFGNYLICPQFECRENEIFDSYAGIIGSDFLRSCKFVTIDFKKNTFVVGGKKIKKNMLPFKTVLYNAERPCEYLFIPIEINGKIYDAMLDTGARSQGIPAIAYSKNYGFQDYVNVKMGKHFFKDVVAMELSEIEFGDAKLAQNYENFFDNVIILSNAFFKNHRIQLDFENMTFAMD